MVWCGNISWTNVDGAMNWATCFRGCRHPDHWLLVHQNEAGTRNASPHVQCGWKHCGVYLALVVRQSQKIFLVLYTIFLTKNFFLFLIQFFQFRKYFSVFIPFFRFWKVFQRLRYYFSIFIIFFFNTNIVPTFPTEKIFFYT